jgi:hypothetical protein
MALFVDDYNFVNAKVNDYKSVIINMLNFSVKAWLYLSTITALLTLTSRFIAQ